MIEIRLNEDSILILRAQARENQIFFQRDVLITEAKTSNKEISIKHNFFIELF